MNIRQAAERHIQLWCAYQRALRAVENTPDYIHWSGVFDREAEAGRVECAADAQAVLDSLAGRVVAPHLAKLELLRQSIELQGLDESFQREINTLAPRYPAYILSGGRFQPHG